jgi:hypothetical protein
MRPTLPVAVLAGAMFLGATVPAASADTGRGGSKSAFCRTARALQDSYERIDETDPDEDVDDIVVAAAAYRQLADEAPAELDRAFRRILRFFPVLEDATSGALDIDDRDDGARYVRAARKAGPAFDKVFDELDDRCGIEID